MPAVRTGSHVLARDPPHLRGVHGGPRFTPGASHAPNYLQVTWETLMSWKTPKIVEVPVGMEINMYACAARK
jgi:coenzyme PQQ precursor peptide PqqA